MLKDFHEGFPALNDAILRNFANWTPAERAEYAERKARAERILTAIHNRRIAANAQQRRHQATAR